MSKSEITEARARKSNRLIREERDALRKKVEILISRQRFQCGFCEKLFDAEHQIAEHVNTCEKHPVAKLKKEIDRLNAEADNLVLSDLLHI